MRYKPKNVVGRYDADHTFWYTVTLPDGTHERFQLAWEATARAHGWTPPPGVGQRVIMVDHSSTRSR